MLESFFNNVAGLRLVTLLKKTPTRVISCEYCEIFKNTYFEENLPTVASLYERHHYDCFPGKYLKW